MAQHAVCAVHLSCCCHFLCLLPSSFPFPLPPPPHASPHTSPRPTYHHWFRFGFFNLHPTPRAQCNSRSGTHHRRGPQRAAGFRSARPGRVVPECLLYPGRLARLTSRPPTARPRRRSCHTRRFRVRLREPCQRMHRRWLPRQRSAPLPPPSPSPVAVIRCWPQSASLLLHSVSVLLDVDRQFRGMILSRSKPILVRLYFPTKPHWGVGHKSVG